MSSAQVKKPPDPKVIEDQCKESIKFYKMSGYFWRTVYYLLGVAAVVIAGLPAAKEIWSDDPAMQSWGKLGAFASPIMVAIIAFLRARQYSDSWFLAWKDLKKAWGKYQNGEITASELWDAWEKAEKIEIKDTRESG